MDEILKVEHLNFDYSDASVLRDVTFTLKRGDFLGIIGANGAGKSTLIKLILGMLPYDNGTIQLFGGDLKSARSRIGYVAQKANSFNSDFPATVKEVVAANLYSKAGLFKRIGKKYDAQVKKALHQVGMAEYENRLIGKLSGGQQQRVFIARALVNEPELLFMVSLQLESMLSLYGQLCLSFPSSTKRNHYSYDKPRYSRSCTGVKQAFNFLRARL